MIGGFFAGLVAPQGPSLEGDVWAPWQTAGEQKSWRCLDSQRSLSTGELSQLLGTPEATLRKDLALLADLGLLKLLNDGAAAIPHYRISRERQERMQLNREKKNPHWGGGCQLDPSRRERHSGCRHHSAAGCQPHLLRPAPGGWADDGYILFKNFP